MTDPHEFICADCGSQIVSYAEVADPKRCITCHFIHNAPPCDRHALRLRLMDLPQLEYWNAVGCYRDEACAERHCDHCDKLYRGPGIFCCRRCALAEAA